ncbi:MAG: thiamine pyrophosphate-binding protein [Gammaproteobacteria bacterium]|nr:thiamine pyrophosphate-binding protein [Gammaproteobacteria bacterium]MYE52507.1 thiamine pyrophosphate-binding protein [Gammaproteobacteria bacterium]
MTFTGADLIAQKLADLNVRHAFGIVSIHNMPIFDAINRLGKTRIIDVRHEQAGTHAADGYARAGGEIGVMLASTGPGTTNTVTGLYEAQYASSKVLLITGQAETAFYGKGLGYVHEAENQLPMLRTVARRVESPRHVGQLDGALNAVVADMRTGRGAPGAVEVPIDLQYAASPPPTQVPDPIAFAPKAADIESAAARIADSQRRLIIAGGGVIAADAAAELQALAERLDAPVVTTVDGRGALPEDHPLCIGNYLQSAGLHAAVQGADLSLAFGVRFAVGVDGQAAKLRPPGDLVQVDIDPNVVGRAHPVALGVVGDARAVLGGMLEALDGAAPNDAQFNESVWEARDGLRKAMRARLGPDYAAMMDLMRDRLPRDGLLVRDSTIAAYNFGNQLFPIHAPRTSLNPASGAIGPGLPLALGAAIATGKNTLVMHGDGGFMFHATELATAAQYGVPLVVCVFNDGGYGVLRWLQQRRFGRTNETDLGMVNFAAMAQSMGVPGQGVGSVAEFQSALDEAMASEGPCLIDIDMAQFAPMEISVMPKRKSAGQSDSRADSSR